MNLGDWTKERFWESVQIGDERTITLVYNRCAITFVAYPTAWPTDEIYELTFSIFQYTGKIIGPRNTVAVDGVEVQMLSGDSFIIAYDSIRSVV